MNVRNFSQWKSIFLFTTAISKIHKKIFLINLWSQWLAHFNAIIEKLFTIYYNSKSNVPFQVAYGSIINHTRTSMKTKELLSTNQIVSLEALWLADGCHWRQIAWLLLDECRSLCFACFFEETLLRSMESLWFCFQNRRKHTKNVFLWASLKTSTSLPYSNEHSFRTDECSVLSWIGAASS